MTNFRMRSKRTPLLLAATLWAWVSVSVAGTSLRSTLDASDMQLIDDARGAYSKCLSDHASRRLDENTDLRSIAGDAMKACSTTLSGLDGSLQDRGLNPGYYYGIIRTIQNRAVSGLLYELMARRASEKTDR